MRLSPPRGAEQTHPGAQVMALPGVTIDEQRIVSSTGALSLTGAWFCTIRVSLRVRSRVWRAQRCLRSWL